MRLFFGCAVLFVLLGVNGWSDPTDVSVAPPASTAPTPEASAPTPVETAVPLERLALDKHFKVTKVHIVNNTESYKSGGNDALEFERKYWNYGAVTKDQQEARRGLIYLISWHKDGPPEDLTARFEYRLVNTRETIFVQSQPLSSVTGTNRSLFEVVGDEYRKNGAVYAWRFTLVRGDQVVALERSYIW